MVAYIFELNNFSLKFWFLLSIYDVINLHSSFMCWRRIASVLINNLSLAPFSSWEKLNIWIDSLWCSQVLHSSIGKVQNSELEFPLPQPRLYMRLILMIFNAVNFTFQICLWKLFLIIFGFLLVFLTMDLGKPKHIG